MIRRGQMRRGFTLADSIVLVIVIALAVPALMVAVRLQDNDSIDRQRRLSAAWLASSVLETVMADAASDDHQLGFSKLDGGNYLTHPVRGLYARLQDVAAPYENLGISYSVSVGSAVDLSGAPVDDDEPFAVREVTVVVSFMDRSGVVRNATFRTIVGNT